VVRVVDAPGRVVICYVAETARERSEALLWALRFIEASRGRYVLVD
jgi:hypothetical protein